MNEKTERMTERKTDINIKNRQKCKMTKIIQKQTERKLTYRVQTQTQKEQL